MRTVVFLLEEPSAEAMLRGFIGKNFVVDPEILNLQYRVYEGKQDLENNLERAIRGWRTPNTIFFVMRDQDAGDCEAIKERLCEKCRRAGQPETIVRIACRELESFYLGDLAAVEKGLKISGLALRQDYKSFREPDHLRNPSLELELLTKKRYQKIEGSRRIGPYLNPEANRSHSFGVLYRSLREVLQP